MSEGMVPRDLLGDPIKPLRDPRGRRPAFSNPSIVKENQKVVMTLRAAGHTKEEIANHLRCDVKTLDRYFSRELQSGATLLQGVMLQVLVQRALEGNVSAAKVVYEIAGKQASATGRAAKPAVPAVPAALGKKAQLIADAKKPPESWESVLKLN